MVKNRKILIDALVKEYRSVEMHLLRLQKENAELLNTIRGLKQEKHSLHSTALALVGSGEECPVHKTTHIGGRTQSGSTADTIRAVLLETGKEMSLGEIVEMMLSLGWQTSAKDPQPAVRTALHRMKNAGSVTKTDGDYRLRDI